jgi:predicted DNA-binding protein (UPF0251 family)/predicted Fe-Mo cluster-binding NifX family protein
MPRPSKCKVVGFIPFNLCFQPEVHNLAEVVLSVEEVEAIRLSDYLEMEQDNAAESMHISRGTFQRIIHAARMKIADALVYGKTIKIEGGNYELSQGYDHRKRDIRKENKIMKIAIATEGTNISGHFGKCDTFTIIEIDSTDIISSDIKSADIKSKIILDTSEHQHGLLPAFLAAHNVNVVISGGMGDGARQKLMENDIEIIVGASGSIDEVIIAYRNGSLKSSEIERTDHGHSHEHNPGEGGCGCGHK